MEIFIGIFYRDLSIVLMIGTRLSYLTDVLNVGNGDMG